MQGAYHNSRVLLKSAIEQYQKERNDPITGIGGTHGTGPPPPGTAGVPKNGWSVRIEDLITQVRGTFSQMCDLVRGDFTLNLGGGGSRRISVHDPDYPWLNEQDFGVGINVSRLFLLRSRDNDVIWYLDVLIPELVDNTGHDLPSKDMFQRARDSFELSTSGGPFLPPNIPIPPAPPVVDPGWSSLPPRTTNWMGDCDWLYCAAHQSH